MATAKQPTKVNGIWTMVWIEDGAFQFKDLNWFDWIYWGPKIIKQSIFGLKFPKL